MRNTYKIRTHTININNTKLAGNVIKYITLTVAGFLFFKLGQAVAFHQRGYNAYGGEYILLALPLFYHIITSTIKEIKKEIKKIINE